MKFHPFAERFPLLSAEALNNLAGSIKRSGQRVPIVVRKSDGLGIDGRNRWRACQMIGVEPLTEEIDVDESATLDLIADLNIARRHLTTGENAELAAAYVFARNEATKPDEVVIVTGNNNSAHRPNTGKTDAYEKAAEKFNVSKQTVRNAVAAIEADASNAEKIRTGETTAKKAATEARAKSKPKKQPAEPKAVEPTPAKDKLGKPIPEKLLPVFSNDGFADLDRGFHQIKDAMVSLVNQPAGKHLLAHFTTNDKFRIKGMESLHFAVMDDGKPHCVCIVCGGEDAKCQSCKGYGFLTKHKYRQVKDAVEVEAGFAEKRKGS